MTFANSLTAEGLVFTSPNFLGLPVGTPIPSWQISATGTPAPTFTATGLPSWAAISSSGALTGTAPNSVGSPFVITITAHNGVSTDATQIFTLAISIPYGNESGLVATTLAGQAPASGSMDGTGVNARFDWPTGVAVDAANNIYVADRDNHTIRKISPGGVVTTLAGLAGNFGAVDGSGSVARFYSPAGIAVDSNGNVYVADTMNGLVRKITPAGGVTTLAGQLGGLGGFSDRHKDGTGNDATFGAINSIAVGPSGNLYVTDGTVIRKITQAGVVTTVAGQAGTRGSADGDGIAAQFDNPSGLALDGSGNIYVADTDNHTIRKITAAGVVTTLAGQVDSAGSADGAGTTARFYFPTGIAVDANGNIYVGDRGNYTIRKISAAGFVETLAGSATAHSGSADGLGRYAQFSWPEGVAVDGAGNIYVADGENHMIRKVSPVGAVTTVAGPSSAGSVDGTGASARFFDPTGVALDHQGTLYVADADNCLIRKITSGGVVTTFAGQAKQTGFADGPGNMATFGERDSSGTTYGPTGVAVDLSGNVFVADSGNAIIRKITPAGVVSTFAGLAGQIGGADGIGGAARFCQPMAVAVDVVGNVFVSDAGASTIRKITPAGVVTTLAGHAFSSGGADGMGDTARFNFPYGLAVDATGVVYVADYYNHTIRKITPGGVVTTVAGLAGHSGGDDGVGAAARFYYPSGVAIGSGSNIYVMDSMNGSIRKITPSGRVTTELGYGIGNTDGVGSQVFFNAPTALTIDEAGTMYVADSLNNTIRKVISGGPAFATWPIAQTVRVGGSASFTAVMTGNGPLSYQWFKNGTSIPGATSATYMIAVAQSNDIATYKVRVSNDLGSVTSTDVVLDVLPPLVPALPFFSSPLQNQTVTKGGSVVFSVNASGFPLPSFQWQVSTDQGGVWTNLSNGQDYSGVNMSSLSVAQTTSQMNGYQYRCVVNNSVGTTTSNVATMTVVVLLSADFNGDGKSDVLLSNTATGDRVIWLMKGTTIGTNAFAGTVPTEWKVSGTADFNGDGKADVLWTNALTGDRAMWLMNGSTSTGGGYLGAVPVEWVVSGTGDFDGDGKADIIWSNSLTGERAVWLMNGSTLAAGSSLGVIPVAWVVSGTGDFNGDGKTDILLSNTSTGDRVIWFMNGTTIVTNAFAGTVPVAWTASAVGDFDGDGKADILWTNTATGDRAVWLMNGSAIREGGYLGVVPVEWTVSNARGDYDGDGKSDIFWTNTATGERAIWLMNGITKIGGASLGVIPVVWSPAKD